MTVSSDFDFKVLGSPLSLEAIIKKYLPCVDGFLEMPGNLLAPTSDRTEFFVDRFEIPEEQIKEFLSDFSIFPDLKIEKSNVKNESSDFTRYCISCSNFFIFSEPSEEDLEEYDGDFDAWFEEYCCDCYTKMYDALPVFLAFRNRFTDLRFCNY
ncbi:MAG: hypothetical protein KME38_29385 [Spirirestis rafaelensis WJT71-NPBG6]|jgi:hypothetical protein|nr:hypothetical protein [Spirirestis rafaelensis WJT71-NPBG6]